MAYTMHRFKPAGLCFWFFLSEESCRLAAVCLATAQRINLSLIEANGGYSFFYLHQTILLEVVADPQKL